MLFNCPPEIIIQIFRELSPQDRLKCQLTKDLRNIVRKSVVLQYDAALALAEAEDNPCSSLPVADKLRALKSGVKAWSFLRPRFTKSVPVSHVQSGVYDLSAGVYLLGNSTRTGLHYLRLPNKEGEDVSWRKIESNNAVIGIGLCLYEHDLIVIITKTPHQEIASSPITYNIELELVEFSTRKPHPQAQENRIHVMNTECEKPSVGIETVGDNLLLILSFPIEQQPDDHIFIYEWKTSVLKTSFLAPHRSYSGPLFLTEHLILMPNRFTNAIDFFRIPSKPTLVSPTPILILQLPVLSENRILAGIACHAEPNPLGAASYLGKKRQASDQAHMGGDSDEGADVGSYPNPAFLASAENAICVFDMLLLAPQMVLVQGGVQGMHIQDRHQFTFIVHRRALVALVEKYGKREDEADPLDVSPGPPPSSAPSEEPLPMTEPDTNVAEDEILSEDKPRSAPTIPWADWGPPISRWFNSDNVSTQWITSTAGQRYVRMYDSSSPVAAPLLMMDFNPHNIRRMKKYLSGKVAEGEESDSDEDEEVKEERRREEKRKGKAVARGERPKQTGTGFQQGSSTAALSDLPFIVTPPPQPQPQAAVLPIPTHRIVTISHGQTVWHQPGDGDGPHCFSDPFGSILSQFGPPPDIESFPIPFSWHGSARWDQYYNQLKGYEGEEEEEEEEDYWGRQDDDDEEKKKEEEEYDTDMESRFRRVERERMKYSRVYYVAHVDKVQPAEAFAEPVHGALPYVERISEEMYRFDGVLLDEERIIGLRTHGGDGRNIQSVEILYFG